LQLADSVKSAGDVAKIDVESMKKSLDTSGMTSPLDKIAGLKGLVGQVIEEVKDIIDQLLEFIASAPQSQESFCCTINFVLLQQVLA